MPERQLVHTAEASRAAIHFRFAEVRCHASNSGAKHVSQRDLRLNTAVGSGERLLFRAMTQHILERFTELWKLKLEPFLFQPFGDNVATVEGQFRVGAQ